MSSDGTALGDRMKSYENVWRHKLPRRSYVLIRLDGKAFHTYTRGFEKPFAPDLHDAMCAATATLCSHIGGTAKFGYVQSDEISILVTDWDKLDSQAWFDNNVQKLVSVSASILTAAFNYEVGIRNEIAADSVAYFDSRVFVLPTQSEVFNYFIWRQRDATRNSISSLAQAHFSHKQLMGKKTTQMLEMLDREHGIQWSSFPDSYKYGSIIRHHPGDDEQRGHWMINAAPHWGEEKKELVELIPMPTIYLGET